MSLNLDLALDVMAAALLLFGSALALAASIGVLRFVDVLSRMHAATKPQSLGILLCLAAAALRLRDTPAVWMLLLTGIFQLVTAPVAAHLIGRLAYRLGHVRRDRIHVDDLASVPEKPTTL
jgi:multicomponent Na+:H+ antiporter subunit G